GEGVQVPAEVAAWAVDRLTDGAVETLDVGDEAAVEVKDGSGGLVGAAAVVGQRDTGPLVPQRPVIACPQVAGGEPSGEPQVQDAAGSGWAWFTCVEGDGDVEEAGVECGRDARHERAGHGTGDQGHRG